LSEVKQKRLAFVLIVVSLLVIAYGVNKILVGKLNAPRIAQPTLQQQLAKYTTTQLQQKPPEPPKLDPKIINKELEKVGQLIVFKGAMTYAEPVENKGLLWSRKVDLQLNYNFGFAIDLSKVGVEEIAPNVVSMSIPRQEIKLAYMELDANTSTVNGTKTTFARQFTPDEIKFLIEAAQKEVTNKVTQDMNIYSKSMDSVKISLEQLAMKLGFKKVVCSEV
jgi:hypothetical protein